MIYDPEDYNERQIEMQLLEAFQYGLVEPKCGICDARELRFEHGETPFKTMEEAEPAFKMAEAANLASRAMMEILKNVRDPEAYAAEIVTDPEAKAAELADLVSRLAAERKRRDARNN